MRARRLRHAVLLLPLAFAGCRVELNRGLPERDANETVAVLMRAGVPASRSPETKDSARGPGAQERTYTVSVDEARFADAVDALRAAGLPRERAVPFSDLFRGNGLVPSPTEERARLLFATNQALSRTIADIDGVVAAHVHVVLPEPDPLRRDPAPATASVLIRHAPDALPQLGALLPQIKKLVTNAVTGLSYDRVEVAMVPAEAPRPAVAQPLAREFGLWVHPDSLPLLRGAVGGALAAASALLAGGLWWWWKRRPVAGAGGHLSPAHPARGVLGRAAALRGFLR